MNSVGDKVTKISEEYKCQTVAMACWELILLVYTKFAIFSKVIRL
jgi:hypothetical protein